jgi:hypothetical protein
MSLTMTKIVEFLQTLNNNEAPEVSSAVENEIDEIGEVFYTKFKEKGCDDYSAFFYSLLEVAEKIKNLSNDKALGNSLEGVKYVSQADVDADKDVLTLTCKTLIDVLDHSEL